MENELAQKMDQLIVMLQERAEAQKEFELRLLEELRVLNRTLSTMQSRQTVGDL